MVFVPATIVVGSAMFTRFRITASTLPVPAAASERPMVAPRDVNRAIAMLAIAAFCLYQQDLLFRVAIDAPLMYAVAAGAFAVGAIGATAQLAWHAPGRLPGRPGLIASLVACAAGTAGLLVGGDALAMVSGLVIGWGCAYGIQGCRPLFAWAPRPGVASGVSIALMTVATATGAPVVVDVLPHTGPAIVLIGGSVVLAAMFVPDVHAAAGAAAAAAPPEGSLGRGAAD